LGAKVCKTKNKVGSCQLSVVSISLLLLHMRLSVLLTLVSFFFFQGNAQVFPPKDYPENPFAYPLNIPVKLNANFGELRNNHFHMGLDLFTLRKENLPVYAPADGWIAKVKIDPKGFGNATYINHYSGLTTLYCHMNTFPPQVLNAIKEGQYKKEKWKGDVEFDKDRFPVKKGDFIGYSGNTGASAGPHVHYEIRRTADDACINPMLIHKLYDVTPPDLQRIAIYDRNKSTYEQQPKIMPVIHGAGGHTIKGGHINVSSNKVGIAIGATDRITGVPNPNGIYQAVLYLDDEPVSGFQLDGIDYLQTRYLNAHIDYRIKKSGGAYWQHVTPLPGDQLPFNFRGTESGCIELKDKELHKVRLEVKDANGNAINMRFTIQWTGEQGTSLLTVKNSRYMFPGMINIFETEALQVVSSEKSYYDAFLMKYSVKSGLPAIASDIHTVHTPMIPVHDSLWYRIKANRSISFADRERVVMVKSAGGKIDIAKAEFTGEWYEAKFREFGDFWLEVDNVPPQITITGLYNGAGVSGGAVVVCTVNEDKKEIRSFRAELDGKWLMFEGLGPVYRYKVDEYCPPGEHELLIQVEDEAGNLSEKRIKFTRI
jgi:murein DD-endopeptidase MepM/ murein hydrolase activator NlpD